MLQFANGRKDRHKVVHDFGQLIDTGRHQSQTFDVIGTDGTRFFVVLLQLACLGRSKDSSQVVVVDGLGQLTTFTVIDSKEAREDSVFASVVSTFHTEGQFEFGIAASGRRLTSRGGSSQRVAVDVDVGNAAAVRITVVRLRLFQLVFQQSAVGLFKGLGGVLNFQCGNIGSDGQSQDDSVAGEIHHRLGLARTEIDRIGRGFGRSGSRRSVGRRRIRSVQAVVLGDQRANDDTKDDHHGTKGNASKLPIKVGLLGSDGRVVTEFVRGSHGVF
mmetsp:Transcript_30404/g.57017  ORF Transcript_30404/g.57017 Transcript_30404/m.57017 type:complete len:273 (-) Transcript_30404:40-858(-)